MSAVDTKQSTRRPTDGMLALARDKKVTDAELRDQVASVLKAFDMITVSKFRALLEVSIEREGA